ncbi:MAG: DUF1134 domain-containing protein [Methyloceanibacter sp.]
MRLRDISIAVASAVLISIVSAAAVQEAGTGDHPIMLAQAQLAQGPMTITPQPDPNARHGVAPNPDPLYQPDPNAQSYTPSDGGDGTFSMDEVKGAGHRFFGGVSVGFAKVIEYAFRRSGRPNGYILGEEAGGAFIAGLRYGEGVFHTKDAGTHRIFWQGPSIGYDFGAEGSKTMVLVYDLRSPGDIYNTFAGVDGSAFFIGGVGITFLSRDDVVLAPIRAGIGLRLGANIGYLKYTREPTWNPF